MRILCGDCIEILRTLPDESMYCCVTSPPYWGLRDYGHAGQLGLEKTPEEYVGKLVEIFREVRRVLRKDGTCWLNLGDSYAAILRSGRKESPGVGAKQEIGRVRTAVKWHSGDGSKFQWTLPGGQKPKDLCGIPWRVAFALQADGWWLRQDIIWAKSNPMPEFVRDRCTKAHEYVFLLTKSARYFYNAEAIKEESLSPWAATDMLSKSNGKNDQMAAENPDLYRTRGRNSFHSDEIKTKSNKRSVWTIATQPFTEWAETSRLALVGPDAFSGDMKHTVSGDCPVHGGLVALLAMVSHDPHEDDSVFRNECTSIHLSPEREADFSSNDRLLSFRFRGQSLDSILRLYSCSAISHNNENRKMALDFVTKWPCTPSAEISGRIGDTLIRLGFVGNLPNKRENRTLQDGMDARLLDQTLYRTVNTSSYRVPPSCTCSFYHVKTEKTSHFATFPEELPRLCILAGCPVGGTVLDPFCGAGTTGLVAKKLGHDFIGIELNPDYVEMATRRINSIPKNLFCEVTA